uniref:Integrase core domain-containing protein n=1 Tax=Salarias fasciatus TaxID=181472 RepID=A0A672GNA6_SALFA
MFYTPNSYDQDRYQLLTPDNDPDHLNRVPLLLSTQMKMNTFFFFLFFLIFCLSEITEGLQKLLEAIQREIGASYMPVVQQETESGPGPGAPRIVIEKEKLKRLLDTHLPVTCIAKCLGVSRRTLYRRMVEFGLSVRGSYSLMSDQELDNIISGIKTEMPNSGYRMVQGHLVSLGFRVQWWRMMASMHRVDAAGIFSRIMELGWVVRRSYSVRGPLSLNNISLLIRLSTNNKASTAFSFFMRSTMVHGLPSRVRADQGVENLDIARYMFATRGTGRASFISGKSVHNQRVERLWRDVWVAVTSKYHDILHFLEEDGLLDISDVVHLFGVHYILSLDFKQILTHLLKDGIIILCGQREVSLLNSCGVWDIYKT